MVEIANLINEVGFPVVVCLGFGWCKKLIESIELYRKTSNELLLTNKELSETNKLLANEIGLRMNTIENTLIDMNSRIK